MTTDRDRSIERLLRRALPSDHGAPGGECPDAETLAALADDTLTAAARRDIEAHLADCHRCQTLTAAMVRSEAPIGAPADTAAGDVPSWRRRALNWLVPAAAAATAVALWVIVPGQRTPLPEAPIPERQTAAAPSAAPSEAESTEQLQAAPPAPGSDAPVQAPIDARRNEPAPGSYAPQPSADGRADAGAPARDARVGFSSEAPATPPAAGPPQAPLKNEESLVVGGLPPSREASADRRSLGGGGQASGTESRREAASNERTAPEQERSLNQVAAGGGQASGPEVRSEAARRQSADQPGRVNDSAKPTASARAAADAAGGRVAAGFDVASPNPRVRWRAGAGPTVQYSADGGASWTPQPTGVSAELTAGSAPTPEVCWIVGRGGVVLRTTDGGRQWQRTPFPEAIDLTAITASTALSATVSLADGRRFGTTDGGRTWAPVR